MRLLLPVIFLVVTSLSAQDWQTWLQQGIEAYRKANYPEAAEAFQRAAELNPDDITPHAYLAMSWFMQYIPGAESPENLECARKAEDEFTKTLELDPNSVASLKSLASLSFYQKRWDDAVRWNDRVIEVEPRNKEAHYTLGVIAWSKFYPKYGEARAQLGMTPEMPGPMPSSPARDDLKPKYASIIDEGISHLEKALEIDPDYDDAMAYMNLLIRERADLLDTPEQWQREVARADEWVQKALETKRRKAENGLPQPAVVEPGLDDARAFQSAQPGGSGGGYSIRLGSVRQSPNLLQRVDPEYPALAREARIQGTVRFRATIGKDGSVTNAELISGHPLLVQAARDAVAQWKYEPTLLNGEPVEVRTTIEVNFSLDQPH